MATEQWHRRRHQGVSADQLADLPGSRNVLKALGTNQMVGRSLPRIRHVNYHQSKADSWESPFRDNMGRCNICASRT